MGEKPASHCNPLHHVAMPLTHAGGAAGPNLPEWHCKLARKVAALLRFGPATRIVTWTVFQLPNVSHRTATGAQVTWLLGAMLAWYLSPALACGALNMPTAAEGPAPLSAMAKKWDRRTRGSPAGRGKERRPGWGRQGLLGGGAGRCLRREEGHG